MIKSMTGYGSVELTSDIGTVHVTLKSVNRKGLDLALSLPNCWKDFEMEVREWVAGRVYRGALTLNVELFPCTSALYQASLDTSGWMHFVDLVRQASELSNLPMRDVAFILSSNASSSLSFFSSNQKGFDRAAHLSFLHQAIDTALSLFDAFRKKEGLALQEIMLKMLDTVQELLQFIATRLDGAAAKYTDKLSQRLEQLGVYKQSDINRWHMEVALLADRIDVREEIDRLYTHVQHFRELCLSGPFPIGRKLDFLTQEMMREINTLMNKAQDAQIAPQGIELKATLERLREQLQNVE